MSCSNPTPWMPLIVGCPKVGIWARTANGVNSSKPPSNSLNCFFIGLSSRRRTADGQDAALVVAAPASKERQGAHHCQLALETARDCGSLPFLVEQARSRTVQFPTRNAFDSPRPGQDCAQTNRVNSTARARPL